MDKQEPYVPLGRVTVGKWTAWTVLVLALAVTAALWRLSSLNLEQRLGDRFAFRIQEIESLVTDRLRAYEQVLWGTAALFAASDVVTRADWRNYVNVLRLEENYPGLQAVGYAERVKAAHRPVHVTRLRREGFPTYDIWPDLGQKEYTSIVYIEPFDWRNRRAFGFDMTSEPVRRNAMYRARDSGLPSITGKVVLVQETPVDTQNGFLMYIPIYRSDLPRANVEQRRQALLGYVYSPFRMNDLMGATLSAEMYDVHLEIFDGHAATAAARLYDSGGVAENGSRLKQGTSRIIDLYGREWLLRFVSMPALEAGLDEERPQLIAAVGIVISSLLFAVVWGLATTRERALALAQEMTLAIRERKAQLREITSTLAEGLYVVDTHGRINFVNPAAERMLGRPAKELLGQDAHTLLHGHQGAGQVCGEHCSLRRLLAGAESGHADYETFRTRAGRIPVEVIAAPIERAGIRAGAVVAFHDISERQRTERELRESERFRVLFEYASDALLLIDEQGKVLDANRLALEITKYGKSELLATRTDELMRESASKSAFLITDVSRRVNANEKVLVDVELMTREGGVVPAEASFSAFEHEGRLLTLVAMRDVTERKRAESRLRQAFMQLEKATNEAQAANRQLEALNQRLRELSRQDALTGVANRRHFEEYLAREWRRATRRGASLAIILTDIDNFKAYNDRYGHPAGDRCLQQVATALRKVLSRSSDLLARYGGEEFVLVLPDTTLEGAYHIGEEIRSATEGLHIPHDRSTVSSYVTLSVGVSCTQATAEVSPSSVISMADQALYEAKHGGRNRVVTKALQTVDAVTVVPS